MAGTGGAGAAGAAGTGATFRAAAGRFIPLFPFPLAHAPIAGGRIAIALALAIGQVDALPFGSAACTLFSAHLSAGTTGAAAIRYAYAASVIIGAQLPAGCLTNLRHLQVASLHAGTRARRSCIALASTGLHILCLACRACLKRARNRAAAAGRSRRRVRAHRALAGTNIECAPSVLAGCSLRCSAARHTDAGAGTRTATGAGRAAATGAGSTAGARAGAARHTLAGLLIDCLARRAIE